MKKSSHLLNKFGFKQIATNGNNDQLPSKENHKTIISVIKAKDHANPQFVIQIKRETLDKMNWEISDRVVALVNKHTQHLVLSKTKKKEKNSFALSVQGYSISVAKELKKGAIVKIGWRKEISSTLPSIGHFDSKSDIFDNALMIKLPKEMFKKV